MDHGIVRNVEGWIKSVKKGGEKGKEDDSSSGFRIIKIKTAK